MVKRYYHSLSKDESTVFFNLNQKVINHLTIALY